MCDNEDRSNFLKTLSDDPNPNFLRYTLFVLERGYEGELFRAIRKRMDEKYSLPPLDPWKEKEE